jgi:hypothetical protein
MEREQSRYNGAPPQRPCHFPEDKKQYQGICHMKENIGKMVATGRCSVDLNVKDVRQPCKRMPVGPICRGERPGNTLQGQPILYVAIHSDVQRVIVADELMACHLTVYCKGDYTKKKTDQKICTHVEVGIPMRGVADSLFYSIIFMCRMGHGGFQIGY